MENYTIDVEVREKIGKSGAQSVRREGFIPGIAYHRGETPVGVKVPYKEFTLLASRSRPSQVFTFKSSASQLNGKSVIVKEIQKDYVSKKVLHVDFQTLKDDEQITVRVAIKIQGEAPGVKVDGGILTVATHDVGIRCLPKYIPSEILVDVSSLNMGESIHAEALNLPANVELDDNPEETIVSVVAIRQAEDTTAATAAPAAEGAEGAAAAAPAAGAAAPAAEGKEKK